MRAPYLLLSLSLVGCSSLGQARRPTADDCAQLDKARQRWSVVETAALGLGAMRAAGIAAFAEHKKEVLTRDT